MPSPDDLRKIALAFPETTEEPHFDRVSFRVKKKIFATYNAADNTANVKLTVEQQDLFGLHDSKAVYPVPNKWGLQGWTTVDLALVLPEVLADILTSAYCTVAPPKLAAAVHDSGDSMDV